MTTKQAMNNNNKYSNTTETHNELMNNRNVEKKRYKHISFSFFLKSKQMFVKGARH